MLKKIVTSKLFKILSICIMLIGILIISFVIIVDVKPPRIQELQSKKYTRNTLSKDFYTCEKSWLKKNEYNLWEMYLEGDEYELGLKNGILARELIEIQEVAFIKMIKEMVPSESYLRVLKYFIAWFNRNIDDYIPLEYQKEIYAVSQEASHEFDYISHPYHRMLNYHGAHDIGHAVQNMHLVACTAFGVKGSRSADGSIIVGRNMDFYAGDDFAKNKIVAFYKPSKGHNFAMITWGGMIGVISGMNDKGLTVSLNSASADIPFSAKTPVSILARKILQYASTIDEAYAIAKQTDVFVAELFYISSTKDNNFAVIEKTPSDIALYKTNSDELIITNHFQSEKLKNLDKNKEHMANSASVYRWNRVNELLGKKSKHDVPSFVSILRNQLGVGNTNIGMANEKAINQLIAHHSIIFKPQQLQMWVSASPYQLGAYVCYDLHKVFSDSLNFRDKIYTKELSYAADTFLYSQLYKDFEFYKFETKQLQQKIKRNQVQSISEEFIVKYLNSNPEFFYTNFIVGEIYRLQNKKLKAHEYYKNALSKEIPTKTERDNIVKALKDLQK